MFIVLEMNTFPMEMNAFRRLETNTFLTGDEHLSAGEEPVVVPPVWANLFFGTIWDLVSATKCFLHKSARVESYM